MTFSSVLLPSAPTVNESRKAILDLLSKLNQLSANVEPLSTASNFGVLDVTIGTQATLPSVTSVYEWHVMTYGATYNGKKSGISSGGIMAGTASANLSIYYKVIG